MKTTFLFTVDVESRSHGGPDVDILGTLPGYRGSFGIELMMDLLDNQQARGTFFLNVYEAAKHGEESIAGIARLIHSRGHDLELHTHPRPMYPFYGMSNASFEEQVEILKKGSSLIEGWTGKRPVAHRAGAFLANIDTLRAIEAAGLAADCSLAPGSHETVPLVNELGVSNLVQRVGSVWEVPVTYYEQVRLGRWRSRRILDIEASSLAEIKRVVRLAIRQGLPTVSILMHSFSFTRHAQPDQRIIGKVSALLGWLRERDDIEIGTIEETCRRLDVEGVPGSPPAGAPYTGIWLTWARALQSWNEGWKNFMVSAAGIAWLAILLGAFVYLAHVLIAR